MSEPISLLELIEKAVVEHGGDLGGWTRHAGDSVQLFDGRVTLRAEIAAPPPSAVNTSMHTHVLTTLHEYEDEVLDACVFGMGENQDEALRNAAYIWITCVAGPIKSFLDDKPICMSCQAGAVTGDPSNGYSRGDYGLPGLRAYVGPSFARGLADDSVHYAIDDTKPWFRFAGYVCAVSFFVLQPSLCLYNAEANVILQAMEANNEVDLTKLKMYPSVVPDRGVSRQTMTAAIAKLNELADHSRTPQSTTREKRWWKF